MSTRVILWLRPLALILILTVVAGTNLRAQQAAPSATSAPSDELNHKLPNWLSFTGEARARLEGFTGGGFKPDNDDAYLLTRVRLNMKVQPTSWLKFFFQGQDAHVFWKNQNPSVPPFQNIMDLRQGYVEVGGVEDRAMGVRLGRQELAFGDERLIGNTNWLNTARSFDGVRGTFHRDGYRVDVFAVSVVKTRDAQFDENTPGNNLYGVYGGLDKLIPKATVQPYFFWRRQSGVVAEIGTPGISNFGTLGVRWVGKLPAGFDYGMEIAKQSGSLGTDTISAWAGHWLVGHTFAGARFKPRLMAEYNYASGDRNRKDGTRGTFDQLYPTAHDKYGLADQVGWKNIEHLRGGVELQLRQKWSTAAKYSSWWLADPHDALYNAASTVVARVPAGTAGRFVGQEIDFVTSYKPIKPMEISGGVGHLFPGAFLNSASPGHAYTFPYVSLGYSF
jgi:hypothetical protein